MDDRGHAAIVNAVSDALRPLGVTYIDPLSPQNVWAKIPEAKGNAVPPDPGKQCGSWTRTERRAGSDDPAEQGDGL